MATPEKIVLTSGGPAAALVTTYLTRAKKVCRDWHSEIKKWRRLYLFSHYDKEPLPHEERYEDPTPTNTVDLAVGVLLANPMEIRASGFSPSLSEERDSSQIEKYVMGVLALNNEREEKDIQYDIIRNFVRDGCGVLYSVWDPAIAERSMTETEVPDQQSPEGVRFVPAFTESPLILQSVDPLKVFLLPGGPKRWSWVFKVERMSLYDVETLYSVRLARYDSMSERGKREKMGDLIDGWCVKQQNVEVPQMDEMGQPMMDEMGQPVADVEKKFVIQHVLMYEDTVIWELEDTPYPDIPFRIRFFKPVDDDNARDWGHSILKPQETTIKLLEKSINRRMRQLTMFSSLPLVAKAIASRSIDIDPAMGNLVRLEPDEDLGFPTWQGNPPDFESQLSFFRARLQQSGFSDVMFGEGPRQVAGYALSQMGDQNRIRLEQPVRHLESLWSSWAKFALQVTELFASDAVVRVTGRIKGQDFMEQVFTEGLSEYSVKVLIKPKFPNDEIRKHAMGTQTQGILSERTRMERYFDIEQPDEERKKRLLEMAENHPAIQQYALMSALMDLANSGDAGAALALQQMLVQQAGGGAQPPQGAAPEQMMGTQGPTGAPPPQTMGGAPPGQDIQSVMQGMTEAAPGLTE